MADAVTVWWYDAPFDPVGLDWLLDDVERERRDRQRAQVDADRFVLGAAMARAVWAAETGVGPDDLEVDRTCEHCGAGHGRPGVTGTTTQVSVSHGGGVVAVAAVPGRGVGVDVEPLAPVGPGTLDIVLAPSERAAVTGEVEFGRIWTRKEAVLKALGTGLRTDPASLLVTGPGDAPAVRGLADGPPPACVLVDLPAPEDHAAALAVLGAAPVTVEIRAAVDLLAPLRRPAGEVGLRG